ncbi:MAG TPA: DUF6538 domain-containing protein [Methylomirabilota bacterium]|jgi:hypothetical protein|nr:DUF6538 domain-containing protein [Methylomirabilota bacterium]
MLMLRGSTWYYRHSVPFKIRSLLGGKAEVWRSLRTSDPEEAKLLSLRIGQAVEREFQALARRGMPAQDSLRVLGKWVEPETFARDYEGDALASDAVWRVNRGRVDDEALDAELLGLTSAVEDHAEALRLQDTKIVSALLNELLPCSATG